MDFFGRKLTICYFKKSQETWLKEFCWEFFQRKSHLEEKNYGIIKIFRRFA